MISIKRNGLVLNILSLSLLALPLAACEGMDVEAPAPTDSPAPTSAPAPAAAEASFNVTTVIIGADHQTQEHTVRMTESQWQKVTERRNAALAAGESGPGGSSDVGEIQQAVTADTGLKANCPSGSEIFFQSDGFAGDRYCLVLLGWDSTSGSTDFDFPLPWSVHSYILTSRDATALICTSNYDCNLYTCGLGSSVWYNAGTCLGHLDCRNQHIVQPPYQTYMSPYLVHLQWGPFSCY
jgi:hypothetical protein